MKKIINNDSGVISEIIEEALDVSGFYNAVGDIAKTLISKMEQSFQMLLEKTISADFFSMLEEAAWEGKDTSRNGYYERKVKTASGDYCIQIPRSLCLEFKTKLLQKYSHNIGDISERELELLYKGGLTANDINQFLTDVQGIGISRTTMQKIVNETVGEAISFNNEDIEDCPFVYLDASYIPFKRSIGIG